MTSKLDKIRNYLVGGKNKVLQKKTNANTDNDQVVFYAVGITYKEELFHMRYTMFINNESQFFLEAGYDQDINASFKRLEDLESFLLLLGYDIEELKVAKGSKVI